jgi:two-component system, NarL family, response regulator NreC
MRTRILLADDHAILRAGLAMLIEAQPDMVVSAEAADGIEAVEKARRTKPDVVILDLTMPRLSGFDALRQILADCPDTRVLILTMHDDPAYGRSLLAAGASGYVTKKAADRELLRAIRCVTEGRVFVDLTQAEEMLPKAVPPLSHREQQVLAALARGFTHQEIADQLALSIKTVETYLARLGAKLGLRRRNELVAYALELGLLDSGGNAHITS